MKYTKKIILYIPKNLTITEFFKEFDKLKKKADKINKLSPTVSIILSTRIKRPKL